jgi:very-short-patch-repair endonuclease
VLDIADGGDARLVERVLASVLRGRHATEAEVRALLARSRGRAGLGMIASLVDVGPAFDRSVADRLLLELLVRADLPRPRMNARAGGFEVDGLWESERVVVEFDSFTFHGDRIAFRRDRRKSARLQSLGFDVVPVVWEDLVGAPELVVAVVASVLAVARERLIRSASG